MILAEEPGVGRGKKRNLKKIFEKILLKKLKTKFF